MKTNTLVSLGINGPPSKLDNLTGNFNADSEIIEKTYAHVSDMKSEMQKILFGSIGIRALTVRFLQNPTVKFDFIEIDGKKYDVEDYQVYKTKASYYVRERL